MAQRVLLCRHGQDEDNAEGLLNGHRDRALTDLGKEQAAATAEKIAQADLHIDVILASPLQRAFNTATIIGKKIGKEVIVHDDLIERDFGALTGRPYADIPKFAGEHILKTDKVNYFLEVEGAEDFPRTLERAKRVLEHVGKHFAGKVVLLVCHGDVGKMIRAAGQGMTWEEGLKTPYFSNADIIDLAEKP